MRSHAKAPSAFTFGLEGVAAPALIALALAALFALSFSSSAFAAKKTALGIGSADGAAGESAGQLNQPRDIAVNETGTGGASAGDIYVVEANNNRVSQFKADGTFVRAFGRDVVSSGPDQAREVQWVTVNAAAGTFNLSFESKTTADLPFNATPGEVQSALNGLESIGGAGSSVSVSGGPGNAGGSSPYVVTFDGGPLAGANVSQISAQSGATPLSGGSGAGADEAKVLTSNSGETGYEICNALANPSDVCKAGVSGGGLGGTLNSPRGIAVNQSTGNLYVTDANLRVQQFSATGQWVRAWGGDVVQAGGAGETFAQLNEIQTVRTQTAFIGGQAAGGNFKLKFNGQETAPIPYNAAAAIVQSQLEGLSNIGPGDVVVSGSGTSASPWVVEFSGALGEVNQPDMQGNASELVGQFGAPGEVIIATTQQGGTGGGFETCAIAHQCKAGIAVPYGGGFGSPFNSYPAIVPAGAPDAGNVLVPDPGNRRMQEFNSSGGFVRAFGFDVAKGGSSGYEVCSVAADCKAGAATGIGIGQFGANSPARASVAADGRVYVIDGPGESQAGNHRIQTFDSARANPAPFAQSHKFAAASGPVDIAVGPANRIFILQYCPGNPGSALYEEFCPGGKTSLETRIREFDDQGVLQESHIVDLGFAGSQGLAANTANDRLYFSTSNFDALGGHRVWVLDDKGAQPPPIMTINPPTDITANSATVSGTVNPNGLPGITTAYRFEVSKNGVTWTSSAANVDLGNGTSPIDVPTVPADGVITGLEANTFYRVRILATRSRGAGETASPELTFLTDGVKPDVTTLSPHSYNDVSAVLRGQLNANNMATAYRFEYGETTAYGSSAPVPDASASDGITRFVTQEVQGLKPETTYHYRLVATNAEGTSKGADVTFTTSRAGASIQPQRAFEMVTPPFKVVRAPVIDNAGPRENPNPGIPSLDGNAIAWTSPFFPLSEDVAAPAVGDHQLLRRTPEGWTTSTRNTRKFVYPPGLENPAYTKQLATGSSGDLETLSWIFREGNPNAGLDIVDGKPVQTYLRRDGTGDKGFTIWASTGFVAPEEDYALFNDAGTAMTRTGTYRGMAEDPNTPGDDDPSDNGGGQMNAYVLRASSPEELPTAPKDLLGECTGTIAGADATQVPVRDDDGTPGEPADDTLSTLPCETGSMVDKGGVVAGGGSGTARRVRFGKDAQGPVATAMSDDGRRVFFSSPDPTDNSATEVCGEGTGTDTNCPAQLFVRQYKSNGDAFVRWISRPQGIGTQQIGQLGRGAAFQGASRDGRFVYFKTNAPLLPSDPNGGASITTGSASNQSWDLYRYELPADHDQDPASGTLTRISGGPSGSADPSTNATGDASTPLRFLSDDGQRAYFSTTSPIAGADATPPAGGTTTPGGEVANEETTRNLYLFDAHASGAERYRFIAQIPTIGIPGSGGVLGPDQRCATRALAQGGGRLTNRGSGFDLFDGNCVRGVPDGDHIVFLSSAQLTVDDVDGAVDVYLYDASADELTRLTAPLSPGTSYRCNEKELGVALHCNGDLGTFGGFGEGAGGGTGRPDQARGWGGMRYENIAEDANGFVSVFFETKLPLIPEDTNGDHWDVYQWHEGTLSLISPGNSNDDSWFSGNSVNGRDVFIWTSQRIDPREIDDATFDIYDARIGGGFPYTPPAIPCDVLAHECRPNALPPAAARTAPTSGFQGAGNVKQRAPRKCRKGTRRRKGKCVAKKSARQKKRANKKTGRASR